jgi:uncharacterized protein (TIGR02328 family)
MRIWHYRLLPYLPDLQFKGQLRELVAIMRAWRDNGTTNHLLINRVMDYPKADLYGYFLEYAVEYEKRYGTIPKYTDEFRDFGNHKYAYNPFKGWHDDEYLKICMANLYEKHEKAKGKTQISQKEWQRVLEGYKTITGEYWKI